MVDSMFDGVFQGKRVLVTGHTGFKGSWLCEWLLRLGAEVFSLSLDPEPGQELCFELDLPRRVAVDRRGDVRDLSVVKAVVADARPDFVFHLAAQPLVRKSYREPVETFATNVMGSVNVLEALRLAETPCVAVMVTTDKCYENREWLHAYREEDAMGGHDPYSASKSPPTVAHFSHLMAPCWWLVAGRVT
jgi:CDP-glucose 4,6-dehydratase